jgi:two-component system, NtrC family, response regulator
VNVRIIVATNRDLQKEIGLGHFREDLYYRISVFTILLPPLRERINDIEELALFFVHHFAAKTNKKQVGLSAAYLAALKLHQWKGNIRELKNVIERSVILTDGTELLPATLPIEFEQAVATDQGKSFSAFDLAGAEKLHIRKVLNYTNGNKTEAAKLLNIALTTLYRKLDEYQIK